MFHLYSLSMFGIPFPHSTAGTARQAAEWWASTEGTTAVRVVLGPATLHEVAWFAPNRGSGHCGVLFYQIADRVFGQSANGNALVGHASRALVVRTLPLTLAAG